MLTLLPVVIIILDGRNKIMVLVTRNLMLTMLEPQTIMATTVALATVITGLLRKLSNILSVLKLSRTIPLSNLLKAHDAGLGQMANKIVGLTMDMWALQDWTRNVKAQVAKIVESQTLILAKFVGKWKPSPVENVKIMRSSDENMSDKLDYSNAPTHGYTVEDFVMMMNLRSSSTEGHDAA